MYVTRLGMMGRTLKVLVFAAVAGGSLMFGVSSSFGATSATPYRTVATDTPTVVSPATSANNAQFGTRLTASKDSTGDGVPDIFIGSYSQDINPALVTGGVLGSGGTADNNSGEITLINGATQKVVWHVTPEPQADPTYGIGFYVSAAGDVNRDGLEDVIASQPYRDIGGNVDQGRLYVLDGKTGDVIRKIESPTPQATGLFAARLGTAGDVTGDGVPDMLVGANGQDFPAGCGNTTPVPAGCRKDEGEAYIFNGATGALFRTLNLPAEDRAGCSSTGRCSFGGTVQSPGDINKDGFPDQIVSAYAYSPPGSGKSFVGRMYLFSGGGPTAGNVLAKIDPPGQPNSGFFGLEDMDRNAPGDLNGDGTRDLYFNAFNAAGPNGESGAGRSWTFDGAATLASGTGVVLNEVKDPLLGERKAFGFTNSETDYDKDGKPDLLVSNLATRNTSFSVLDGRTGAELKRFNTPAADVAADPNGAIGWSSRAPGDLNGDCEPDYVAGAPYQDVAGNTDQGRVYFFLSNGPGTCPAGPGPGPGSSSGGGLTSTGTTGFDTTAPGVRSFGVLNNPFAVSGAKTPTFGFSAAKKHRKGTAFTYTLSEAATVRIVITQRRSGRRQGIRCVAPRRSLRKKAKCTMIIRKGTLTRVSKAGANRVAFSGRIASKALSPGTYSATITATDTAKNTSGPKTISFKIVKR